MNETQAIAIGVAILGGLVTFAIALYAASRARPRVTTIETRREDKREDGE